MRKLLTLAFVMTFVQALGLGSPFTTTQAHAAAALAPARPQQAPAAEEADDPLRGNYNVATASDLLLVWTEQPGDVPPTTSFQKIYEVQPNPSAPPLYTLDTGNAKQSETGQNGVHGNEHISAATGDFDYAADSLDEEIAVGLNYYLGGDIDSATADTYLYLLQSHRRLRRQRPGRRRGGLGGRE